MEERSVCSFAHYSKFLTGKLKLKLERRYVIPLGEVTSIAIRLRLSILGGDEWVQILNRQKWISKAID